MTRAAKAINFISASSIITWVRTAVISIYNDMQYCVRIKRRRKRTYAIINIGNVITNSPISQSCPSYPSSQLQVKESTPSVHEPCSHGSEAQSSVSAGIKEAALFPENTVLHNNTDKYTIAFVFNL